MSIEGTAANGGNSAQEEEIIVEGDDERPPLGVLGEKTVADEVLGRQVTAAAKPKRGRKGLDPAIVARIEAIHAAKPELNASQIKEYLMPDKETGLADDGQPGVTVNYATVRKYIGDALPSHKNRAAKAATPKAPRKPRAAAKARAGRKPGRKPRASSNGSYSLADVKLATQLANLAKSMGVPVSSLASACNLASQLS